MKYIKLTRGEFAMVDDEDFERVMAIGKWQLMKNKTSAYAVHGQSKNGGRKIYMHLLIMNASPRSIDHRDSNGLNNQKRNLRRTDRAGNSRNRKIGKDNTSGYKGVCFSKAAGQWQAQIYVNNKAKYLGFFETPQLAAVAYDAAAIKLHGEFARTNAQLGALR